MHKIIVMSFIALYFIWLILVFAVGVGARCEKTKGPINSKTYPLSFVVLFAISMTFWFYTVYLKVHNYDIDPKILQQKADE